ncbi:MAG: zinc-binding dehydrogenase, partial [Anaerolineae bacterium]|nr:zinc-binding dehydrogenase [Anaerolineae bacterium]
GKITPVLDRSYPLQEAGDALRRVGGKQGIGKVIIVP